MQKGATPESKGSNKKRNKKAKSEEKSEVVKNEDEQRELDLPNVEQERGSIAKVTEWTSEPKALQVMPEPKPVESQENKKPEFVSPDPYVRPAELTSKPEKVKSRWRRWSEAEFDLKVTPQTAAVTPTLMDTVVVQAGPVATPTIVADVSLPTDSAAMETKPPGTGEQVFKPPPPVTDSRSPRKSPLKEENLLSVATDEAEVKWSHLKVKQEGKENKTPPPYEIIQDNIYLNEER